MGKSRKKITTLRANLTRCEKHLSASSSDGDADPSTGSLIQISGSILSCDDLTIQQFPLILSCASGNLGNHEATIDRNRDHCGRDCFRLEQTFRRMGGPDDRQRQSFIGRAWGRLTKKPGFVREAILSPAALPLRHRDQQCWMRGLTGCAST